MKRDSLVPFLSLIAVLIVLLAFAGASRAATFVDLVTDVVPVPITHCGLYKNNVYVADFPAVGNACRFRVTTAMQGNLAVYSATAVYHAPPAARKEGTDKSNAMVCVKQSTGDLRCAQVYLPPKAG